jgi:RNA polymerase sigma factor FliA
MSATAATIQGSDASEAAARERMISAHLGLVHHVARKLSRSLSMDVDWDELVSAGTIGLMNAISKYDPSRGLAFSTFAAPRIRGAILDELRKQDHVPRSVRRKNRELAAAREELYRRLGREPRDAELAEHLGIDMPTFWRWQAKLGSTTNLSFDQPTGEKQDQRSTTATYTYMVDTGPSIEDLLNMEQEAAALRRAILQLKEQERVVLSCYYFESLTLSQIAEILNLTESRISQIRAKALSKLRSIMAPLRADIAA